MSDKDPTKHKSRKRAKSGDSFAEDATRVSRREFIKGAGVASVAASAGALLGEDLLKAAGRGSSSGGGELLGPGPVPITLRVNSRSHALEVEPRLTLLDALRDRLDITGSKKVCDRATCGACTMIVDGKAIYSCTVLAIDAQDRNIETIEGIAPQGKLHPISQAFVDNDAQQCGFCTPGFVMACKAYLDHEPNPTYDGVKRALGGNLCRCGTYMGVRRAVLEAAKHMKGGLA